MIQKDDIVIVDTPNTDLTLFEVLGRIDACRQDPRFWHYEFLIDGDTSCVLARPIPGGKKGKPWWKL